MHNIIDKTNPIPLYIQLGQYLVRMIRNEEFKVGGLLPSEEQLSRDAGVNRNTVRHAISLLVQQGLVEKRKGIGTAVKRRFPLDPVHKLNRMTSFVDDFEMDNVEIEDRIIFKEKIPASDDLAGKLGLGHGAPVVKIGRLRIAEKMPLVMEIQYYSFSRFGRLLDMNIKGSMYEILTQLFDADLDHSQQSIRAVCPSEEVADNLGIPQSTPCIFLESLAYTADELCIEVLRSYYRGDRYLFKVETREYHRGIGSAEK
jgi:GntR family transcriptional regulator